VSQRRSARPRPQGRRARRTAYGPAAGPRPDRVAGWAVALGIFLILVASASSRGATTGGAAPVAPEDGGSAPATAAEGVEALPAGSSAATIVARMSLATATWYGPGFYGRRTACGVVLRRSTEGVAHRGLPCGTRVTLYRRGRLRTVPVIDRGPYARGVSWDLTAATATAIGLRRTGRVRVLTWPAPGSER
jgi:hypothetical protein